MLPFSPFVNSWYAQSLIRSNPSVEADAFMHHLKKGSMGATHVAFAIVHSMDYLLTWNRTHLANATLQQALIEYCHYHQIHVPVICPPELLARPQT